MSTHTSQQNTPRETPTNNHSTNTHLILGCCNPIHRGLLQPNPPASAHCSAARTRPHALTGWSLSTTSSLPHGPDAQPPVRPPLKNKLTNSNNRRAASWWLLLLTLQHEKRGGVKHLTPQRPQHRRSGPCSASERPALVSVSRGQLGTRSERWRPEPRRLS